MCVGNSGFFYLERTCACYSRCFYHVLGLASLVSLTVCAWGSPFLFKSIVLFCACGFGLLFAFFPARERSLVSLDDSALFLLFVCLFFGSFPRISTNRNISERKEKIWIQMDFVKADIFLCSSQPIYAKQELKRRKVSVLNEFRWRENPFLCTSVTWLFIVNWLVDEREAYSFFLSFFLPIGSTLLWLFINCFLCHVLSFFFSF